jgi:hypothetical protein
VRTDISVPPIESRPKQGRSGIFPILELPCGLHPATAGSKGVVNLSKIAAFCSFPPAIDLNNSFPYC